MSNQNSATGFQFVRNRVAASPTFQRSVYQISSTNANSFGKGDVMIAVSTGYVDKALTSSHSVLLGIFDGCEYYDSVANKKIFSNAWLAPANVLAGSALAYINSDINSIFGVQSGNGGPVTIADVFSNASMGGNGAPSTTTGISTAYLDFNTINTTSTLLFRIEAVPQNLGNVPTQNAPINNDSTSEYNYVEVSMNTSISLNITGV